METRLIIEKKIKKYHDESYNIGIQLINDEYNGDMERALLDTVFVERMQATIAKIWNKYLDAYKRLEELEREEGYLATKDYARVLDLIARHLPVEYRKCCYYPFSGIDFYWARIFKTLICQDIVYNKETKCINAWWGMDWYSHDKIDEIISLLKDLAIIPQSSIIKFLSGDADETDIRISDVSCTTLLIKGGHDVLDYLNNKFDESGIIFRAIIIVSSANSLEDMCEYLSNRGYEKTFSDSAVSIVAPYAMNLNEIHIFIKNED